MSNILRAADTTTSETCEWIGKGERCSLLNIEDRNYCETHIWKVYARGTKVRNRKKQERKAKLYSEIINDLNSIFAELEMK